MTKEGLGFLTLARCSPLGEAQCVLVQHIPSLAPLDLVPSLTSSNCPRKRSGKVSEEEKARRAAAREADREAKRLAKLQDKADKAAQRYSPP